MKRVLLSAGAAVALAVSAVAQPPAVTPLPPLTQKLAVSPDVKIGTLPNGLRYYIRRNAEPAKRAELRLVVNAGSILEDDDQLGYAHFLEHTAFNGTTHFKKNDLFHYLQSIGLRVGADLNASTGFDATIYQLSVPTDTARIVETAMLILEDWAHGQTFDSTEVVNERGVVAEEWRGALGAGERMQRVSIPIILKGSKYAQRMPIGTEQSILRAQPSALRRFYRDWYRPDLMAVVAVGDFDVATMERMIRERFSGLTKPATVRPRTEAAVPANPTPLIAITSDPEATSSSVTIGYKHPRRIVTTVGDYRGRLVERLYLSMLNARLGEIARKPDAPFLGGSVSNASFFAREVEAFTFGAGVKDGGIERGAEAVLAEARRVDQFGFLASELQRAKDGLLRGYERAYAERAKTSSAALVEELVGNFLDQEDISGIEAEYALTRAALPGIGLTDVNTLARDWITDENRIVLISVPRKPGVPVPTEAQMLAVFDRAARAPVTAYTETLGDEPLIDRLPAAGRIVSTKTTAAIGLTEWTLSNGARVLIKPTDFKADEVLFGAYSFGGTSLSADADYMSASNATLILTQSGLGRYNATDLGKKLAGKAASVSVSISSTTESLAGGGSPKDLETLFQLVHLRFTAPRLDTLAWQAIRGQIQASLANRGASPQAAFGDTLNTTLTQHHFRTRPPSPATLAEVNPQRALEIYRDRFANAGDFTFVFVGSVSPDSLRPLVEKYLASLPGTGRVEGWKDVGGGYPAGAIEKVVRKGTEQTARTQIVFTGTFAATPQTRFDQLALTTVAQMWLIDALREQMGGTYSPSIGGGGGKIPRPEYAISVSYSSSPENVDKLSARVFSLVDSLRNFGPSAADVAKVKEQIVRGRETTLKTNVYWMTNILGRDQAGEDVAGLGAPYDALVNALTPRQIQDAAKLYLDPKRYVKVVLLPER